MINKSISYRLSIYISSAVIIVFVSFIIVSYIFDKSLLKENIEHQTIEQSSKIINQVEKLVVSTKEITSNISDQILFYSRHDDEEYFTRSILERYPFLEAIHINIDSTFPDKRYHSFMTFRGDSDRILFTGLNKPYYDCDSEKEMVQMVIQQNKPGWTEPFRCSDNKTVLVSYVSPIGISIENHYERIGEAVCELSLSELNDSINAMQVGDNEKGYAFLVSENGDYITHPNSEWILNRNLYSTAERVYDTSRIDIKQVITNHLTGTTTALSEMNNNEKNWIYYTSVKETGWLLIFVLPYNELFQPLYIMILQLLFFSVVGILVIYFIITFITNKLVEPLSTVTSQLKKFSNLSGQKAINTLNEVKLISESLNYLKSWYDDYRVSQRQEKRKSLKQMQDLEQASEIQQSLIKTDFSTFSNNGIDLFAIYKPARVVSGDLFDYFYIDDDNLVFCVGDVSGKGVPAAIFMSIAQTIIKSSTTVKKAKNIVAKANNDLYTNNQHQFFLTLFVGVLNLNTGILNYCNAAHTATLILKKNWEIIELTQSHGLPLGIYPDKKYSDKKIQIEKGDKIILYTDGIIDLQNKEKKQLELDGFIKIIHGTNADSAEKFVKEIEKKIKNYQGETKQTDDITLFVIQY